MAPSKVRAADRCHLMNPLPEGEKASSRPAATGWAGWPSYAQRKRVLPGWVHIVGCADVVRI
eukprot:1907607-Alexandrium_andersonii.AAC.1